MLCSHNFGNYSKSNPRWALVGNLWMKYFCFGFGTMKMFLQLIMYSVWFSEIGDSDLCTLVKHLGCTTTVAIKCKYLIFPDVNRWSVQHMEERNLSDLFLQILHIQILSAHAYIYVMVMHYTLLIRIVSWWWVTSKDFYFKYNCMD